MIQLFEGGEADFFQLHPVWFVKMFFQLMESSSQMSTNYVTANSPEGLKFPQ
jgi:hypothetical protein